MGLMDDLGIGGVVHGIEHAAGEAVEAVGDTVATGLDDIGLQSAGNAVRHFADAVGDRLGATPSELNLGQTQDPKELVHGDPDSLADVVGKLQTFAKAFEETAQALKQIDSGNWTGQAAEAFHTVYQNHPREWENAADACTNAANALNSFVSVLRWAQGQAAGAIAEYNEALTAHTNAVNVYNQQVAAYNSSGGKTAKPGPFVDPGKSKAQQAQAMLNAAREQRNSASQEAVSALNTAAALAPPEPSMADRLRMDASDALTELNTSFDHLGGGIIEGVTGIVRMANTLNPFTAYNMTHPATYLQNVSATAAGLGVMATNPVAAFHDLVGAGWSSDPAEALGRLVPNVALAVATGGGGEAADAAADAASAATRAADVGADAGLAQDLPKEVPEISDARPTEPAQTDQPACNGVGEPVDAATGAMYLPETDLVLPGVLPLVLTRRYHSRYDAGRCFGRRWASSLDERIEIDRDGVVLVGADGELVTYPHGPVGSPADPSHHAVKKPLTRMEHGGYRLDEPVQGLTRHYGRLPDAALPGGIYPLVAITDRHGNRIIIRRDDTARVVELEHSGGYRVLASLDEAGHVTAVDVVEADGSRVRVRAFGYDEFGHLTQIINGSGQATQYAYEAHELMTSWTDRNGYTYRYEYDSEGRVVAQDGDDGVFAGTFDYLDLPDGRHLTRHTDSTGAVNTYLIDENYDVAAVTDPLGNTTAIGHDSQHRPDVRIDALGRATRYRHDESGQLAAQRRPDGREMHIQYHAPGKPSRVKQFDDTVWTYQYDEHANLTAIIDPVGGTTQYEHHPRGGTSIVTTPAGGHTLIDRNPAGLPIAVTDPNGSVTRYVHDSLGRVVAVHRPDGTVVTVERSIDGKPLRRKHSDGTTETWTWDGEGNLLSHTDASGNTTSYTYGPFDKPTAHIAPDGAVTRYRWDTETRLTAVTNPQGLTWTYSYDPCGRLASETDFDGLTTEYRYDPAGQLVARVRDGVEIGYRHDELGDVIAEHAADGEVIYTRDPMGRILTATGDVEVVFKRDALGRVTCETVDGNGVDSVYDGGRRIRRTTPTGSIDYHHDPAGRLVDIQTAGRHIRFEYDPVGRETRRTLGRGLVFETSWTSRGLPAEQTLIAGSGSGNVSSLDLPGLPPPVPTEAERLLLERTYTYRPDTALAAVHDTLVGARTYALDAAGRVTAVTGSQTEDYGYDVAGNLTTSRVAAEGIPDSEGARNEYHGTRLVRGGRSTWHHDHLGRPVRQTVARLSRKPETWHYEWDSRDRLRAVTTPDGNRWTYTYDPFGRRVRKTGVTTAGTVLADVHFTWDGDHLAAETDSAGKTTAWTYRPGGVTPIAQHETETFDQSAVDRRFYAIVTDLVGSVTSLVDPDSETIAGCANTTLWGQTTWTGTATTPLRFPGQYFDPETGLHYNRHRYYHPDTARYLTTDPLGLTPAPNPATYVDNPTGWIDPLGLAPISDCGAQDDVPSRNEAFRNAKRDLDIPMNQQPDAVTHEPFTDKWGKRILDDNGMPIDVREYTFTRPDGSRVVIQDHGAGHYYGPSAAGNQGPHFNVRPDWDTRHGNVPGTQDHYPFGK
ncbi:putative T7SS-secreted protein [Nocardia vaccinii]|uniref:putative T7SS-secreted protein n=1 Tax=Nocardia vaccinii TaxID=1822 RepID=UPI000AFE357D|nr:DUF6531 domain-containing protein [Nocardia vaccinii]